MIDDALLAESTPFAHLDREFRLLRLGPALWDILKPDGTVLGRLSVLATAGEDGEPVYAGAPTGQDVAEYEGSDWRAIVKGVINEADLPERDRHDVNPPAAHVRGGLIGRVRSEVDGLS